jgi:hypothetical protein
MVKKKSDTVMKGLNDYLNEVGDRLDRETVKFQWAVVEHTPAYNTGGYYDQDIPEENVVVSDYFDEESEAEDWRDQHEPDKGKELRIWRRRLLRETRERWVWY